MNNRFLNALNIKNQDEPPIWLMRQAGRYHGHYQNLRQQYSFIELCQNPDLAAQVALGPIDDFDFDAAILFSDILFPIEIMGPKLAFNPGPSFSYYLQKTSDLNRYQSLPDLLTNRMTYQKIALEKTRASLPDRKGLIGFVGGLLTLYIFAVKGSHKGDLSSAKDGMLDGRFDDFMEKLLPMMIYNMILQAKAKPDCLAILDSAAGFLSFDEYHTRYLPFLQRLIEGFRTIYPDQALLYYGKNISYKHWDLITDLDIQALGVDHSLSLPIMLEKYHDHFAIQGNLPPEVMSLDHNEARKQVDQFLNEIYTLPASHRRGWICGLGHGILPSAKEENVRYFVQALRKK